MPQTSNLIRDLSVSSEPETLFPLDRAEAFLRQVFPELGRSATTLTWEDRQGGSALSVESVDVPTPDGRRIAEVVTLVHTNPRLSTVTCEQAAIVNRYATLSSVVIPDKGAPVKLVAKVGIFDKDRAAAERVYAPLLCTEATILGWYANRIAARAFRATAEECPLEQVQDLSSFLSQIDACGDICEALGYIASPGDSRLSVEFPWEPGAVSRMFRAPLPPKVSNQWSEEELQRLGGDTALLTATTTEVHSLYGPGLLVGLQIPVELRSEDAADFINALNRWELSAADTPPLFGSWSLDQRGPTFTTFIPGFLGTQIAGILQSMLIWNQQRTIWLKRRLDTLNSRIPASLIRAYESTRFRVLAEDPFTMSIGSRSLELVHVHAAGGVECSAFVSACNPGSQALDDSANAERHAALIREIAVRGLQSIEGVGEDSSGDWPSERSLLVLGLSPKIAREIGAQFGQNAVVWTGADGIPGLILLR